MRPQTSKAGRECVALVDATEQEVSVDTALLWLAQAAGSECSDSNRGSLFLIPIVLYISTQDPGYHVGDDFGPLSDGTA
jgi:hypothetical protein